MNPSRKTTWKKALKGTALGLAAAVAFQIAVPGAVTPADAAAVIQNGENSLNVETNRGVLLKLDRPAENIFVANPDIADVQVKSARLIYVFGKSAGETSVYAVDANDNVIYSATVHVSQNIASVKEAVDMLLPTSDISLQTVNDMIVMTGHALSPDDVDTAFQLVRRLVGEDQQIMNRVQISTPTQVNLRVKIAEMSRDTMKTLGFNWEVGFSAFSSSFFFGQGRDILDLVEDPNTGIFNPAFLLPPDANSIGFNNLGGKHDVTAMIDALEDEGYLSILAEPNLTAISGETASFLAGGEFPVPIPRDLQGRTSIEFKEFGVGLQFTPTVLSENKINLRVSPEVSQLSETGAIQVNDLVVPALTTRRASTVVELGSGQSFAIAGLLQNNIRQTASKFPFLGDIPILGTLFRSDSFQREETELVIIITPYIVRPVDSPNQLMTPADVNHLPEDAGRYIKQGTLGGGDNRDLAGDGGLSTGGQ